MYKYQIEDAYQNRPALQLYKDHFRAQARGMIRKTNRKYIQYFAVAKYGQETVGAFGIVKLPKGVFIFSHIVVHPDHRQKCVGRSMIYIAVRYCFQMGAKVIRNKKQDNEFSHEGFTKIGFVLEYVQGRNKQQNRRRELCGLPPIPKRYIYELTKKDFPREKVNRICQIIESGKQKLLMKKE